MVDGGLDVWPDHVRIVRRRNGHVVAKLLLELVSLNDSSPGPAGDSPRHAMEPRAERLANPDRVALAHEHQERGLKCVVGVMRVADHAAAKAQDHRPVAFDQNAERLLARRTPVRPKALEQLAVGECSQTAHAEERIERPPF